MATNYLYNQYSAYKIRYIPSKTTQAGGTRTKSLSEPNNTLAIKLFNNIEKGSVFSPTSISFALSLLHLSADGNTDLQLTKLFEHKYTLDELNSIYKLFNNNIMKLNNALLINKTTKANQQYLDQIRDMVLISVDDFNNRDKIITKVNNHIYKNTNGMIRDVIKTNDIDINTILILINTIYFKANWLHRFDKHNTTKMPFYGSEQQTVDMMYQKNKFNYYENNTMQLLEMQYIDKDYSMGIILSKNNTVPQIQYDELKNLIDKLSSNDIKVYIPKFTHRKNTQLVPILQKLGVVDLFNHNAKLNIADRAYVSKVIHEAVVLVDEEGTEASAVTVVIAKEMAMMPRESIVFKADHPFIYYIRHIPTNMILFYGSISKISSDK
ncbi:serpin [Fadolivirus algeromassiliense]|jgi:serpin B/serpin B11/12|uniref:Serpin n=1 Tax=Fadolivirus FV1/VV64 TaxID=3070911 RepID=A0A7D3R1S5_9VIRU|nr:serpin [Fadolivirus algeromassiliense]QKF94742.1 serpin [Fadolivirus FV1/VV64]